MREAVIDADPEEAYRQLQEHRQQQARVETHAIRISGYKGLAKISAAKKPFLDAILKVLEEREEFWPLTDRQIHYALLNDPPLFMRRSGFGIPKHDQCYKATCELITSRPARRPNPLRADPRPDAARHELECSQVTATFLRREMNDFLKGFYRDLQQSATTLTLTTRTWCRSRQR